MVTILVSGSGTGVGKTRVTAALARLAARTRRTVQIVKPVQTGVAQGEPTDAVTAAGLAGLPPERAHTLRSFPAPIAPIAAANRAGAALDIQKIMEELRALPTTDLRLIEGAGGVAVPLGPGDYDWMDFAREIGVAAVVLVVRDELGAINQTRLAYDYARKKLPAGCVCGVLLNALTPPPAEVAGSTREALLACQVPIWGELAAESLEARLWPPLPELLGLT